LKRSVNRPKLRPWDRFLWIWLLRFWPEWRSALIIVEPETVIAWHGLLDELKNQTHVSLEDPATGWDATIDGDTLRITREASKNGQITNGDRLKQVRVE
jgi:hypothetical protein